MTFRTLFLRLFLLVIASAFFGVFLLTRLLSPELAEAPRRHDPALVHDLFTARDPQLSESAPRVQVPVSYAEGTAADWWPQEDPPLLQPLVDAGDLPPLTERVGPEPLVLEGVNGNGVHGGTWTRLASSPGDVGIIKWRLSASTLFRWSPQGEPIVPHIAKGYTVSDDYREWTIHLRRGMKWSDGHPFTADDFMYWWEKEVGLLEDGRAPRWMTVRGEPGSLEKVDRYTIRFIFPHPKVNLLELLASPGASCFEPGHYLGRFHPMTGDRELIEATKKQRGIDRDRSLYNSLDGWNNVDMPRVWPWIYRSHRASPPQMFVRNPYYFAVDSEGRQLPYLDRVLFQEKSLDLIPLAAAGGDISMQTRHIRFADYTLLMEKSKISDFSVLHWFPASRSVWSLFPNLNRRVEEDDPVTEWKSSFLNRKEFRQALSLAINRERIIQAEYSGVGKPSQIEPGASSAFHSPTLAKSFTAYDPDQAVRMLDVLGLDRRDREGMRTFPDGTRMTWYIDFTDFTGEGPAQFIVDDWAAIGIRAIQRERSRSLFGAEKAAYRHDFTVWTGESEFDPVAQARTFVPTYSESFFAPGYGTWFAEGGLYGGVAEENQLAIEPPEGSPARRAIEVYDTILQEPDPDRRQELFSEIFAINAEEVWSISIATPPPQLALVRDDFHNVPGIGLFGANYNTPGNMGMETFYWTGVPDSDASIAAMRSSVLTPDRQYEALGGERDEVAKPLNVRKILTTMIWLILLLLLILVSFRHPFIGRRFVILIPTLVIISIGGFALIQLPPGSYVETKIIELQMTGDESSIREVEQLVEQFYLDEPMWKQYVRWIGVPWFLTFDDKDKGLLQGYMGRTMEGGQSVNHVVGDRVILTFTVSLGTILFTYFTALPIGIFSAVRQYSIPDYIFTFLGFIGMCVPNFLLAILLMYWSSRYFGINVTGLFSIEYATTPEWSWGKVVDLLKHIWVPILIIGTSGTASMIRVMRGNLLDELKKPYVTTARAKGMRPVKLLMKYPVRLALNPFISGIGGLFPMLVSGGAIVAIVLSLPMVGPLMMAGLLTQDIYMAASLLMMFSFLGVIGTLVSDLLLLWVDPRIRMEGGSK